MRLCNKTYVTRCIETSGFDAEKYEAINLRNKENARATDVKTQNLLNNNGMVT
jgi:hypothetical protein